MLSALLTILSLSGQPGHPGPPFSMQLEVEDTGVLLMFNGEQQYLNGLFGLEPDERFSSPVPTEIQAALEANSLALLLERSSATLDGTPVAPTLEKALFFKTGLDNYEPTVEVHLRYAWPGQPEELVLRWDLFPPDDSSVPGVVRCGEYDFQFFKLDPAEPGMTWYPSKIALEPGALALRPAAPGTHGDGGMIWPPLLVLALGAGVASCLRGFAPRFGAGVLSLATAGLLVAWSGARRGPVRMPTEGEAVSMFSGLHRTIYGALAARSEDEMYATLASAVDEDYIEDLYLELRESMIRRNDGGAWCQVTAIEDLGYALDLADHASDTEALAFELTWRWQVDGEVTHYGHTHTRRNVHRARYAVVHDGEGWKIRGREVLAHERSDDGEPLYPLGPVQDRDERDG